MGSLLRYAGIWGAAMRYSITRQMMFRGDFLIWLVTDTLWISVNVLAIEVIYRHTDGIAGWSKFEMLLLIGSALLQQRLFMGLFLTGFHEMGRAIRQGTFDFFIAQPGSVLFMVSTRRLELDGISNSLVAAALVGYSVWQLGIEVTPSIVLAYFCATVCGVVILYSVMALLSASAFWITKAEGIENGFFTVTEFARLPRQAYTGIASILVGASVIVLSSNVPANLLRGAVGWEGVLWLLLSAIGMLWLAAFVFRRGLARYTSASS
jgi:ABC-2 type transport system permease protein